VANGRAGDPVEARVVGRSVRLLRQYDADADRAGGLLPVGDDIGHRRIVRIDRLDDGEPAGVGPLHFHRIAGVVAVHRKPATPSATGAPRCRQPAPSPQVRFAQDSPLEGDGFELSVPGCGEARRDPIAGRFIEDLRTLFEGRSGRT
jgi:hypothetical protein